MRQRLRNALTELQSASAQTAKILERLSNASERLSSKSSSTLFGCLGGFGGLTSAYIISLLASAASLPVLGVLLTGTGILVGVLGHRGRRRFALERRIEENRIAADEILDRIKSLPKNTPQQVRDDLWLAYRSLTRGFHAQATKTLEGSNADNVESPQLLLPQARQEEELNRMAD
jgi:hypothetical protein